MWSVGTKVVRRSTKDVGVLLETHTWPTVLVEFGAQRLFVSADELALDLGPPDVQLAAGEIGDTEAHALRVRALYLQHASRFDPTASLNTSRIEPQPHQVFIAHRVTRKLRPRMLLADEVGLGKTIEAGLILKTLISRQQAQRILVVAPASLCQQWQTEMRTKFNEEFEIIDGHAASHFERQTGNPFAAVDRAICSLPFVTRPGRREQVLEAGWDMVVFDEAHRVRRTRQKSTQAYDLADELKEQVEGLLLLTATPMQLDPVELYFLAQLVEPGLFRSEKAFDLERGLTPNLNALMRALDTWTALTPEEQALQLHQHKALLQRVDFEDTELVTFDSRSRLVDRIAARHPLSDLVIRNRKAELGLQGRRIARRHPVHLSDEEREIHEAVTEYLREGYAAAERKRNLALSFVMISYQKMLTSSSHALRSSLKRRISSLRRQDVKTFVGILEEDPAEELSTQVAEAESKAGLAVEMEIALLEGLVRQLGTVKDSKAVQLVELLHEIRREAPDEKTVIFTQFVDTQKLLKDTLEASGFEVEVFNGDLTAAAKEEAVRRFRESAQVLISTAAGGEGRNLQFANQLINYDMPWNPMQVEQRIGRLDRIGQRRPVMIHNLICRDTLEERVVEVLENRICLFEHSVGSLDPILGDVERQIERLAFTGRGVDFVDFGETLEAKVMSARLAEKRQGDLALDRSSFRRDEANELLGLQPLATQRDVESFCSDALEHLGGHLFEDENGCQATALPPRVSANVGLSGGRFRGTFDVRTAREADELDFFAFGHTLVDRLVRHFAELDTGVVGVRAADDIGPGVHAEIVWRITANFAAPESRLIRHVIGQDLVSCR